jgi:hypothetical protein
MIHTESVLPDLATPPSHISPKHPFPIAMAARVRV